MSEKVTFLALLLFATLLSAASNEKLSQLQIAELAIQVRMHISDDFHVTDAPPRWIWVQLPEKRFPQLSASIRKELSKKYTIVTKESELPADAVYAGDTYTSWNGFMLEIEARNAKFNCIELTYSYYGGPMAPSRQSVQYEWVPPHWKIVSKGDMAIY